PPGWLAELAATCRRHGTLLVADEIFTGFGRTGDLFVSSAEGATPDLLCCGKALGGGLPIAAVVAPRSLLAAWDRPGEALHTATFLGHPLACAAALATLETLEEEDLPARAARLGRRLEHRGDAWLERPGIRGLSGRGLLWSLELDSAGGAGRLARRALESGLLALASGPRLQLVPPLVITERQWSHVLDELDRLLSEPRT
ncbi:MAG: aminotransferase class III-fold pyridoxal phosphate-dependent enzyme, partial [Thermoanaerobaculia bacterium]|nr:aminotransferase class III-fold pyridoxal phosphate-dependent enzyme [Thermoanaerobaculia bacterium]